MVTALTVGVGYLLTLLRDRRFFRRAKARAAGSPTGCTFGDLLHRGKLAILTPDA